VGDIKDVPDVPDDDDDDDDENEEDGIVEEDRQELWEKPTRPFSRSNITLCPCMLFAPNTPPRLSVK